MREVKQKQDRQTKILSDNNNALQIEVERLSMELEKSKQQNRNLDVEVKELKERKNLIQQWEGQVGEIVQWYETLFSS